jgi:hypothetical protein
MLLCMRLAACLRMGFVSYVQSGAVHTTQGTVGVTAAVLKQVLEVKTTPSEPLLPSEYKVQRTSEMSR